MTSLLNELNVKHVECIGFTGTRHGMNERQRELVRFYLKELKTKLLRHGDCIGADAEAHAIADSLGMNIIIHPPVDEAHRAFCHSPEGGGSLLIEIAKRHFARNRDIVNLSNILVACPVDNERQKFGGTWYTYDYALKQRKPVICIYPDGRIDPVPSTTLHLTEEIR